MESVEGRWADLCGQPVRTVVFGFELSLPGAGQLSGKFIPVRTESVQFAFAATQTADEVLQTGSDSTPALKNAQVPG